MPITQGRRLWRNRPLVLSTSTHRARRQKAKFPRPHRSGPRGKSAVIIHTRDADATPRKSCAGKWGRAPSPEVPALLHLGRTPCPRGDRASGFYISFSGILAFQERTEALQAIARALPLDRLLVETDAPYLAPDPHRGRTNHGPGRPHGGQACKAARPDARGACRGDDGEFPPPVPQDAAPSMKSPSWAAARRAAFRGQPSTVPTGAPAIPRSPSRTRCSVLVKADGVTMLINTPAGPARPAPRRSAGRVDAVSAHDHACGDLNSRHRRCARARLCDAPPHAVSPGVAMGTLHERFGYCFRTPPGSCLPAHPSRAYDQPRRSIRSR